MSKQKARPMESATRGTDLSLVLPIRNDKEVEIAGILNTLSDPSRSRSAIKRLDQAVSDSSKHDDIRITRALIALARRDPDPEIRANVIASLGGRTGREVVGCLRESLLMDSDQEVRWHSGLALQNYFEYQKDGKARASDIASSLIDALGMDASARNRDMFAKLLGDIGVKIPLRSSPLIKNGIASALAKASRDPDKDVRMSALWALSNLGRPKPLVAGGGLGSEIERARSLFDPMLAIPSLTYAATKDPDKDIRDLATSELDRLLEWKKTMEIRKASGKP